MATHARSSKPNTKAKAVQLDSPEFGAYQEFLGNVVDKVMREFPPTQPIPALADFSIHAEAGRVALIRNQ